VEVERNLLSIGSRVRLRRIDLPEAGTYSTRVEDIDETRIVVQPPFVQGMPVSLPPGTRVELEVDRRQLPGQGLYRAVTVVLGKDPGELGFVYLQKPESWQRVQAREFFRVPAMLAVQIRAAGEENAPWMIGQTRDISGGGCLLMAGQRFAVGQAVELILSLPDRRIAAKGMVKRVNKPEEGPDSLWALAIAFTEIAERDRDAIIRYAMKRQIELRKKGLA